LADHALFKMVWQVLLRPLRPEFMLNFSNSENFWNNFSRIAIP
jgi:hypothetical protein